MFDSLESFYIHVLFSFVPIFSSTNLTIEIKELIFLIAASSIHVIVDKIWFNSIAILILGSIELVSYESERQNLLRKKNILDNERSDY